MRRIIRILMRIVTLAILLVMGVLAFEIATNWQAAKNFPKIISAYYAKEACTCLYVLERSEPQCHEMVRQYIPISSFQNDSSARRVTVTGLGRKSVAAVVDERRGCRLIE